MYVNGRFTLLESQEGKMNGKTLNSCPNHGICLAIKLNKLARQINCLDINKIAEICVNDLPKMLNAKFASLYLMDDANEILRLQTHNHPYPINKIVSLNQTTPSPMITAVRSKEIVFIENIDTHSKPVIKISQRPFADKYNTKNCIIIPLICHGRVVAVLNIADKAEPPGLQPHDRVLIELFSQLAGESIGNVRLFKKIQKQAKLDGLTGLVNHKTFYDTLEKEVRRSERYGGQIALIMADIDNLKSINDVYGHRAGDKVISHISHKIKECIRQIDTASRYGGDEFAVILPNTKIEEATCVAQRIVDTVSNSPVAWDDNHAIKLSISIGVGQYDGTSSPEDITSKSDAALYNAKRTGKNNIKVFQG